MRPARQNHPNNRTGGQAKLEKSKRRRECLRLSGCVGLCGGLTLEIAGQILLLQIAHLDAGVYLVPGVLQDTLTAG